MPRYKLTIAYDGTDFCGWQKQEPPAGMDVAPGKVLGPRAEPEDESGKLAKRQSGKEDDAAPDEAEVRSRIVLRTAQAVVERAVREVVHEPVQLLGASRTDAGVHARGQVAAFTCGGEGWPLERGLDKLIRAINSRLPEDCLIGGAEVVADSFNPIGDCTAKGYSYSLHVSPDRPLWDRRFTQHVWMPLDLDLMNEAAARIVGEYDFAAFAAAGHGRLSTVRRVFDCRVVEEKRDGRGKPDAHADAAAFTSRRLRIDISGNGFLWNMVRIIAGTLVEVGRGRLTPDDVAAAIESKDRRKAGPTLPPTGLCLEWVRYGA